MKSTLLTLLIAVALISCDTESIPFISDAPIVANTESAYSYTVVASSYTSDRTDQLNFSGEEIQFSLTLAAFSSGTGEMTITAKDGTVIKRETLDQNKTVAASRMAAEDIESITISFENFSGSLVVALSQDD